MQKGALVKWTFNFSHISSSHCCDNLNKFREFWCPSSRNEKDLHKVKSVLIFLWIFFSCCTNLVRRVELRGNRATGACLKEHSTAIEIIIHCQLHFGKILVIQVANLCSRIQWQLQTGEILFGIRACKKTQFLHPTVNTQHAGSQYLYLSVVRLFLLVLAAAKSKTLSFSHAKCYL